MGQFDALIDTYKLHMLDLTPGVDPKIYDTVELKYDGFFVLVRIKERFMQIITSGGDIRGEAPVGNIPDAILIGEWIYGTNWAKQSSQSLLYDKIVLHNIVEYRGETMSSVPYCDVKVAVKEFASLLGSRFIAIDSFSAVQWRELWENQVLLYGFEGLVFKSAQKSYFQQKPGRMKKEETADYVIMGYTEGKGRLEGTLGAIVGGLYVDGVLKKVCTVGGGFSDEMRVHIWGHQKDYLGKVMTATGKSKFPSGALRHPAFQPVSDTQLFRDDKRADQCILE